MLIHVVQSGETLSSIAKKYGVTVQGLLADNGLTAAQTLVVGQALAVALPWETAEIRTISVSGYAYPHVRREVLIQALPALTWLSVFSYGFRESGELIAPADDWMITLAYEYRAAPLLVLSSLAEDGSFSTERVSLLLNSPALQERVISRVLEVMRRKGYLGVDLDFEYIRADDRDAYTAFVGRTAARLRAEGYSLSVALAPKTSGGQPGLLYEGHDYEALGAAADRLFLMTYEWGYTYGPPMAVAPIGPVRQVIRYAASVIPARKLLMGLPNYGYDWTLPYERGQSRAVNLGNEAAVRLAARQGVPIRYDEEAQSPYFRYSEDEREHVVWFEDVRSIRAKLAVCDEFSLRGVGYWSLMRPFRQNWAWLLNNYGIQKVVAAGTGSGPD